jgi:hypothetical protein
MTYHPSLIFLEEKKKPSDASLVGPISDNPRVARNSGY